MKKQIIGMLLLATGLAGCNSEPTPTDLPKCVAIVSMAAVIAQEEKNEGAVPMLQQKATEFKFASLDRLGGNMFSNVDRAIQLTTAKWDELEKQRNSTKTPAELQKVNDRVQKQYDNCRIVGKKYGIDLPTENN
jgi:hypothetical protein